MGLIFAVPGHIEQIKSGTKTQTRRLWKSGTVLYGTELRGKGGRLLYAVGKTYAVIPGRGQKSVGRIRITKLQDEWRLKWEGEALVTVPLSVNDALAEGGYTPEEYDALWLKMYPKGGGYSRLVIEFEWVGEEKGGKKSVGRIGNDDSQNEPTTALD